MIIICFQILGGIYIVSSLILYIGCYFVSLSLTTLELLIKLFSNNFNTFLKESRLYIYYFITLQVIEIVFLTYLFIYSLVGQPSLICNLFSKIASDFVEKCSESPGILTLILSTLIIFKTLHLVLLIAFDYRIQLKVMTKKAREAYSNNILEQRIEST